MIIIYGGAFNPPTKAHQTIKAYLINKYNPNWFIFLPVGMKYPKPGLIPYQHRENMLKLIAEEPNCVISDFEQTNAFNGTISALDYFSNLYQERPTFVLGADNLKEIETWVEKDRLIETYQFIVIDRDHEASRTLKTLNLPESKFRIESLDLKQKSSLFRHNQNKYAKDLDEKVLAYIQKHHLYEV
ncbi:MAG: nicotinate-nicotinamide nucleotide adenylyltransferase [Acholeplasma sp.]|nr:nicotinate-nicotinamide nucleotide adenylyltransferase [Acholeplasma sp.]